MLHIGSVSGQVAAPFMGAYVGTKHALEGIAASWRRELRLFGIPMILIGLGVTQTPIWDKGINLDAYQDTPYLGPARHFLKYINQTRPTGLLPGYVAGRLVEVMEARAPAVRYTIVPNRLRTWVLPRLLPAAWLDWLMGEGMGLKRPKP